MSAHVISYLIWALAALACNLLNASAIFAARRQPGREWLLHLSATLPFIAVCSSSTTSVEERYWLLVNILIQLEAALFVILLISTAIRDRRRASNVVSPKNNLG